MVSKWIFSLPVFTSQTLIVQSLLPVSKRDPSSSNTREFTSEECAG